MSKLQDIIDDPKNQLLEYCNHYVLIEKDIGMGSTMKSAYALDGGYIGDQEEAEKWIVERGVIPELASPTHNTCSIGFCEAEQSWHCWSHRARYHFGIGDSTKKCDCSYYPANKEDFIEDVLTFWGDNEYHEKHWAEEGTDTINIYGETFTTSDNEMEADIPDVIDTKVVKGVWINSLYNDKVPNEKLRGTINRRFCEFPTTYGRGEWTVTTLTEARQMACDFANGVS